VLLFIITVLVIRLISNSDTESQLENSGITKQEVTKDDILNKIDSNEEYQEVIDKKNQLNEKNTAIVKEKDPISDLQIPQQEADNVPLVIETPKPKVEPKRDLFGLDKEAQQVVKKEIPKVVKKVEEPKTQRKVAVPKKETSFSKKSNTVSGYFIQIGAFTKEPNKSLLKTITTKGYSYKVHPVMIKDRLYNKVLIGPYDSRTDAVKKLTDVKTDFKNPNAYILKF